VSACGERANAVWDVFRVAIGVLIGTVGLMVALPVVAKVISVLQRQVDLRVETQGRDLRRALRLRDDDPHQGKSDRE
jgi:hypothetical protein